MRFLIIFVLLFNVVYANNSFDKNKTLHWCNLPYSYVEQSPVRGFHCMIRTCKKCGEEKDLELFKKVHDYKFGRGYVCTVCENISQLKRYHDRKPKGKVLCESLSNENWKDICGYENRYQISDLGRVKSISRRLERILVPVMDSYGYYRITLISKDGDKRNYLIHRLVGIHFIPNPENKPTVNHKFGIKTDNRASQLEWFTVLEQNRHAVATGLTTQIGESHRGSIFTDKEVIEILTSKETTTELSKRTGWKIATISKIRTRKNWKHITHEQPN